MFAAVQPNDTLGSLCQRHQLSREAFFQLNPQKIMLHTQQGVPTTSFEEGEVIRVAAVILADTSPPPADGEQRYERYSSTGGDAAVGLGTGVAIVATVALTVGFYYLVWRGVKSVAADSVRRDQARGVY